MNSIWYKSQIKTALMALETSRKFREMGYHAKAVYCQQIAHNCRRFAIAEKQHNAGSR